MQNVVNLGLICVHISSNSIILPYVSYISILDTIPYGIFDVAYHLNKTAQQSNTTKAILQIKLSSKYRLPEKKRQMNIIASSNLLVIKFEYKKGSCNNRENCFVVLLAVAIIQ